MLLEILLQIIIESVLARIFIQKTDITHIDFLGFDFFYTLLMIISTQHSNCYWLILIPLSFTWFLFILDEFWTTFASPNSEGWISKKIRYFSDNIFKSEEIILNQKLMFLMVLILNLSFGNLFFKKKVSFQNKKFHHQKYFDSQCHSSCHTEYLDWFDGGYINLIWLRHKYSVLFLGKWQVS